jgi:hypothetical protein
MVRIWQANKGDAFFLPVLLKGGKRIGPYGDDLSITVDKLAVLIPQAR